MIAFLYLLGAGLSAFVLLLVLNHSLYSYYSFLDNFVKTCTFFFYASIVIGFLCTFVFCLRGFLAASGMGEING